MSHQKLRPFIVKVSVLDYFPLPITAVEYSYLGTRVPIGTYMHRCDVSLK